MQRSYFFVKPRFITTLIILMTMAILISLGFWQLHRFHEKRSLETRFAAHQTMAPLTLLQAQTLTTVHYEAIQLEGYFDNAHSFLLDNQFYKHQVGYQVITPLFIHNDPHFILINRGWIPMEKDRNTFPKILPVSGKIHIKGFLYAPKKNPFISTQLESTAWPQRIQALDLPMISHTLHHDIYPWVILLNPKNPYGFTRNWQPVSLKSTMHLGYAFQWFLMAMVLFIIYCGMHVKRKK